MSHKKFEHTFVCKIMTELNKLELGESLNKQEFIIEHWGYYDFYTMRSFDVHFHAAKKKLLPTKRFKTKDGLINRIL